MTDHEFIRIVFDGPPSHISGRFIEVETEHGNSISFGEWIEGEDGLWYLQFPNPEAMLNEHAKRKQENGLLRQRLRYYGVGLLKEADKFDALADT